MWFDKHFEVWRIGRSDALPCPRCGSDDIDVFANTVECLNCECRGPDHSFDSSGRRLPEFACDWRYAVRDWNAMPRSPLLRSRFVVPIACRSKPGA